MSRWLREMCTNVTLRAIGAKPVMRLQLVCEPSQLESQKNEMQQLLQRKDTFKATSISKFTEQPCAARRRGCY